jgi:chemotaxis-related protein WspB
MRMTFHASRFTFSGFMLVLQFYLGDVMYVIECDRVQEVAPMVALKKVPHAPECVAGLFNYRGMIVPVIDLRQFIHKTPCQLRLSTRIILVEYLKQDKTRGVFGIMAERITEAVDRSKDDFIPPGIAMDDAPYLGGILMENKEMIQLVDLERLAKSLQILSLFNNENAHVSEGD